MFWIVETTTIGSTSAGSAPDFIFRSRPGFESRIERAVVVRLLRQALTVRRFETSIPRTIRSMHRGWIIPRIFFSRSSWYGPQNQYIYFTVQYEYDAFFIFIGWRTRCTCVHWEGMFASIGRRDDTSANTTRFTSTSSEMAQHDSGSAGVEDLPQDVTRHGNRNARGDQQQVRHRCMLLPIKGCTSFV